LNDSHKDVTEEVRLLKIFGFINYTPVFGFWAIELTPLGIEALKRLEESESQEEEPEIGTWVQYTGPIKKLMGLFWKVTSHDASCFRVRRKRKDGEIIFPVHHVQPVNLTPREIEYFFRLLDSPHTISKDSHTLSMLVIEGLVTEYSMPSQLTGYVPTAKGYEFYNALKEDRNEA
jgi:hypothetical protein